MTVTGSVTMSGAGLLSAYGTFANVFYREINPSQEPFDNGTDASGRPMVSFNILCIKDARTETFLEEIVKILVNAGVGVYGTTIFASQQATLPINNTTIMTIRDTGGTRPLRTQNSFPTIASRQPGAQITVRGETYAAARRVAFTAYDALARVRNQTVNL